MRDIRDVPRCSTCLPDLGVVPFRSTSQRPIGLTLAGAVLSRVFDQLRHRVVVFCERQEPGARFIIRRGKRTDPVFLSEISITQSARDSGFHATSPLGCQLITRRRDVR